MWPRLREDHLSVDPMSPSQGGLKGGAGRQWGGRLPESYRVYSILELHILTFAIKVFHPVDGAGHLVQATEL